jgi:two-component sensor histidine kinase
MRQHRRTAYFQPAIKWLMDRRMNSDDETDAENPAQLLASANLSDALESDRFRQFLDHVPFAVVVSELQPPERLVYANLQFERLTGISARDIEAQPWTVLPGQAADPADQRSFSEAIQNDQDYIGVFTLARDSAAITVDAWSNIIQDDDGTPSFRLVAFAENIRDTHAPEGDLAQRLREKDTLLRELQHRVKNNLQMVTALIRLETRNLPDTVTSDVMDRLAGRIEALGILYDALSVGSTEEAIDLGIYLSQVASAVMHAHAVEGIRLNLKVDTWPVSINVAMPTGLVVNELLTNALKHAFQGREGGTIILHSLVDETGCHVIVEDDGIGLTEGTSWPQPGKLGALIVKSLRQNAKASFDIVSTPGKGVRVTIFFARANAAPETK